LRTGWGLRGSTEVAVVQAADFWNLHDPASCGQLDRPGIGCVLVEREVGARLPGAVWRRENFLDLHALDAMAELLAIDLVTVAQEVGRRGVVRERVHDLLRSPESGRMFSDVEVDDAPAMVGEPDEDEQESLLSRCRE
jgi:hypothetical protein